MHHIHGANPKHASEQKISTSIERHIIRANTFLTEIRAGRKPIDQRSQQHTDRKYGGKNQDREERDGNNCISSMLSAKLSPELMLRACFTNILKLSS